MSMILSGDSGVTFPNSTVQASSSKVLQVVSASYATEVSTSSLSYTDTGLTATITPLFATSQILVIVNQCGISKTTGDVNMGANLLLLRNSTPISQFGTAIGYTGTSTNLYSGSGTASYSDSPATTSAVTYKTQFSNNSAAASIKVQTSSTRSTITLMEIAA